MFLATGQPRRGYFPVAASFSFCWNSRIRRVGAAACRDLRQMRLVAELDEKRVLARQVVRHGAALLSRDLDDRLTRIEQLLGRERPRIEQHVGRLDQGSVR